MKYCVRIIARWMSLPNREFIDAKLFVLVFTVNNLTSAHRNCPKHTAQVAEEEDIDTSRQTNLSKRAQILLQSLS